MDAVNTLDWRVEMNGVDFTNNGQNRIKEEGKKPLRQACVQKTHYYYYVIFVENVVLHGMFCCCVD